MATMCRFEFATENYGGQLAIETGLCDSKKSSQPPTTIASITSGVYFGPQSVTLTCVDTEGISCTNIYYTVDGSTPASENVGAFVYSDPINITALNTTTELRYFGIDNVGIKEKVKFQSFTIEVDTKPPVTSASLLTGFYNKPQSVTLSCVDANSTGCGITYYTLDGSIPTTNSGVYTTPINITAMNAVTTINYFSIDKVGNIESINSQFYTLDDKSPNTNANILAGTFPGPISVILSCDDTSGSGCKNTYFTIDGSIPTASSLPYNGSIILSTSAMLRYFSTDNAGNGEDASINSQYYIVAQTAIGTTIGPEGGTVTAISIDVNNIVYAGTDFGGLFKTIIVNNLPNWSSTNLNGNKSYIRSIAIHPTNPSIIYVVSQNTGVYKSIDRGLNWNRIYSGKSRVIKLDPLDPNIVYIGTEFSGMQLSKDGGSTFVALNFLVKTNIFSISIDPASTIMFVATSSGFFNSSDNGSTWSRVNNSILKDALDIEIYPSDKNIIYAVSYNDVHKSIDSGMTWNVIKSGSSAIAIYPKDLIVHPTNPNIIYLVESGAIFKSTNGGTSWAKSLSLPNGEITILNNDLKDPRIIYAGSNEYGIYRTINSGASWQSWNKGLLASNVYFLSQDPVSSQTLYAGVKGITISTNGGASWSDFVNYNQLFKYNGKVRIDPNDVNNIFVTYPTGINHSTDGGATWNTVNFNNLPIVLKSDEIIFDTKELNVLYALVSTLQVEGYIYKSLDNGISWFNSSTGLPSNINNKSLTIDTINNTLYVFNDNLVFKSTNSGLSWTPLNTSFNSISELESNPKVINELYLSSYDGLFKSINGGENWLKVSNDLSWTELTVGNTQRRISSLKISPFSSNILYAGTSTGLYRSRNEGKDWDPVTISNMNSNIISDIRIDYTNDNIIYLGTYGAGVWKVVFTP